MAKSEQQQIKQLRAKIRELELMVTSQQKLIEIMKSMPGVREVKLEDEDTKSKSRVHRRTEKRSGSVAETSSTREPEVSSEDLGRNDENPKIMEKKRS
jgi:hypothetical protein